MGTVRVHAQKRIAPLTSNPSPSRGEGGLFSERLHQSLLLPLREKVGAERSDEGCPEFGQGLSMGGVR